MGFELLLNGRWEIVRRLGEGGMGEVYLAHDRHQSGRPVALKILRAAALEGDALEHFRDEFRSLARLRHPNLVEVFDFGQVEGGKSFADGKSSAEATSFIDGAPFLTQELVDGPSLAALPRATRRADFESIATQALRALDAIHAEGWLHNDLKPQNILISPPLRVRLVDFGLARRLSAEGPAAPSGTLHYLAPERLQAATPDRRSDLYALGAVLYESLTGRTPFEGKSAGALVTAILHGGAAPPRALETSIPERWERLVLRLLERDPKNRFASAEEALAALHAGSREPHPRDTAETFAGRLRSAALTGRDDEVARLDAAIAAHLGAARAPGVATQAATAPEAGGRAPGRIVMVGGTAGSGKSRLVEEARQRLQLASGRTLSGRADEFGGHALQPFDQVLAAGRTAGRLPVALEPALEQALGPASGQRGVRLERTEIVASLARALDALADGKPGVLFLEDLHWASPAALDLLEHLAVRETASPWLIVLTLRDDASRLAARWSALAGRPGVSRIDLAPMEVARIERVLEAMLPFEKPPARLAERLHALKLNQPFHGEEILKSLFEAGFLTHRGDAWSLSERAYQDLPLPESIADRVLRRFDTLPKTQAELARLLAIFGKPTPLATLTRAFELAAGRRSKADPRLEIEALARLGLVSITWGEDASMQASIAQSSVRQALARRLPAARRRALHRAALQAIEAVEPGAAAARVEDLAYHAAEAGERESAARYLLAAAGRASAVFDTAGEAGHLRRALEFIPLSDRAARLETTGSLVEAVASNLGDYRGGLQIARQLRSEAQRAGSRTAEICALRYESFCLGFLGKTAAAERIGRRAIAMARTPFDPHELPATLGYLGILLARNGRPSEAVSVYEEAVPLARASGDDRMHLWILNNAALTRLVIGDTAGTIALYDEVFEAGRRLGATMIHYRGLGNIALARLDLGDLTGAVDNLESARAWAREHTALEVAGQTARTLQSVQVLRGRYDLAAQASREARKSLELQGAPPDDSEAHELDGRLALGLGRVSEAMRHFQEGLAEARRRHEPIQEMYLLIALAEGSLAAGTATNAMDPRAGGPKEAASNATRALAIARRLDHDRGQFLALRVQALAARRGGGSSPSRAAIERIDDTALRFADRLERGLLLATLDLDTGQPASAATRLRSIIRTAADAGASELEWRARAALARALETTGTEDQARRAWQEAATVIRTAAGEIEDAAMKDDYLKQPDRENLLRQADKIAPRRAPAPGDTDVPSPPSPAVAEAPSPSSPAGTEASSRRPEVRYPAAEDESPISSRTAERTLATLFEITQVINTIRDPEKLLNRVMDLAIENVRAERGVIFLFGEQGEEMEPVVARNVERQTIKDATEYSRTILREAGRGRPILSHDALQDNRFREYRSVARLHIRSLMCVPLSLRGRTIGTVYVDTRAPGVVFDREDLRFLESFAAQAAVAVENARLFEGVRKENESLKQQVRERYGFESLVGRSRRMHDLIEILARVAPSNLPVLILGESGTGKELVARAIHQNSPRRDRSFQTENCAAFGDTLLESQLFGHVRGAFTGADTSHRGLFEQADGGTLFLDEVGDMSLAMQSKLLRVLQNGEIRPVGSEQVKRVNVRVVSATNRPLEELIREKKFREDLYYRLRGVPVALPALRDRRDDIPLLVDHFLGRLARENGGTRLKAEPALLHHLARLDWRGNVRELENTIYRLALYAEDGVISAEAARRDLELMDSSSLTGGSASMGAGPSTNLQSGGGGSVPRAAREPGEPRMRPRSVELSRAEIKRALSEASGSRDEAARILQVSRATLFRKMKDHGLTALGGVSKPPRATES
ncbi:MAG TPA: sigma 54-interacting transcriptional regulator [Candidatus Polarisedimenticolia bacterium]|nr:sigma 54-interacting transcriptional regulator [Candidatus Polarisedimenticolia bacterium]